MPRHIGTVHIADGAEVKAAIQRATDDDDVIALGARNRYEEIREQPGVRAHWPPWEDAPEVMRETYRGVFANWLRMVRAAEAECSGEAAMQQAGASIQRLSEENARLREALTLIRAGKRP